MPVLDPARLESLRKDLGEDGALEVAQVFFREGPKRLEELSKSLAARDRATLERAAHSLKSNARLFGATELGERCAELEAASRATIPADARACIDEIRRLHAEADAAIRATMHPGPAPKKRGK
jgi:histidine phosphotransfer protein HptB